MAWICAMGENDIAGKPGSFWSCLALKLRENVNHCRMGFSFLWSLFSHWRQIFRGELFAPGIGRVLFLTLVSSRARIPETILAWKQSPRAPYIQHRYLRFCIPGRMILLDPLQFIGLNRIRCICHQIISHFHQGNDTKDP
jgi:hypothetical protein